MEIISVEVDEEFVKGLEAIKQPYLDRSTHLKHILSSWLKQCRIELPIKKLDEMIKGLCSVAGWVYIVKT